MLDLMGVDYTLISDASDQFDTPSDGEFRMYDGGTKLDDVKAALNAKATISLQHWSTRKTLGLRGVARPGDRLVPLSAWASRATDELLMKISELSGKAIPRNRSAWSAAG